MSWHLSSRLIASGNITGARTANNANGAANYNNLERLGEIKDFGRFREHRAGIYCD
jgi:hypothetical protein